MLLTIGSICHSTKKEERRDAGKLGIHFSKCLRFVSLGIEVIRSNILLVLWGLDHGWIVLKNAKKWNFLNSYWLNLWLKYMLNEQNNPCLLSKFEVIEEFTSSYVNRMMEWFFFSKYFFELLKCSTSRYLWVLRQVCNLN